jgi:predicted kinase
MPKLYVLVGVPGSGKSTWARGQSWVADCDYVSTDDLVEAYAQSVGRTYSEVFDQYMPEAVRLMTQQVVQARRAGRDVIWDQTSTTVASRARKFYMLPDYYAIAVVFPTPDHAELKRRLSSRPGKTIPEDVVAQMVAQYEEPTELEGFREIWRA